MRFLGVAMLLVVGLTACSESDIPADGADLCAEAPSDLATAGFANEAELQIFLSDNKVEQVNSIGLVELTQFAWELKKMPASIRSHLAARDAKYRILHGQGVSEDPQFLWKMTGDGRDFSRVSGAAWLTTWTVTNRIYKGGMVNLVLHERGHTLDAHGVPGRNASTGKGRLSSDPEWIDILKTDTVYQDVVTRSCGVYCDKSLVESFADAFAMYYACPRSHALMARSPRIVKFMESLVSATAVKKP